MSLILQNTSVQKLIADEIIKSMNEDRWDRFIATSLKPEQQYRHKMRAIFAQQLDEILTTMNRWGKGYKALEDALIDFEAYRIQYEEFSQLMLPGILEAWASQELEALEVGISFDVLDPNVIESINRRSNLFSDSVINETRDQLHQVIIASIEAGDGIPQLEKKIRALYADMSKRRAVRIARTETIWGQNEGAMQSYIQSGVVEAKEFFTARDERTCPFCASQHGKIIPLGINYFDQGSSLTVMVDGQPKTMIFNYEDVSHPPIHVNCRCTLIPVVSL